MRIVVTAISIFLASVSSAHAKREYQAIQMLQTAVGEHAKRSARNASALGHLRLALRALDEESQKNNAVRRALEQITKAQQLASGPTNPRVIVAIGKAREIVEPAERSPMSADLDSLREKLREGPVAVVREVVADDVDALAGLSKRISQLSLQLTEALSTSSAALVGRTAE